MNTHRVIDLTYHEDEYNQTFIGTYTECTEWISEQPGVNSYEIVPLTKEEIESHKNQ